MIEAYKKGIESIENDEMYLLTFDKASGSRFINKTELKAFLRSHTIALIEAEIEWLEKTKVYTIEEVDELNKDLPSTSKEEGHIRSVQFYDTTNKIISHLKEQLELIKNS